MKQKIVVSVAMIYAVLAALLIIFLGGAAVEAHEQALTPFQFLTLRSQSEVFEEAVMWESGTFVQEEKSEKYFYAAAVCAGGITLGIPFSMLLLIRKEDDGIK